MPETSETVEATADSAPRLDVKWKAKNSSTIIVDWIPHNVQGAQQIDITRTDKKSNFRDLVIPSPAPLRSTSKPWTDKGLDCPDSPYTYTVQLYDGHGNLIVGHDSSPASVLNCRTSHSTRVVVIGHDVPPAPAGPPIFAARQPLSSADLATSTVSQTIPEGAAGTFALLNPRESSLLEYIHGEGTILQGQWHLARTLGLPKNDVVQDTSLSLIQSSSGKLGAIAHVGPAQGEGNDFLVAYELSNLQSGWTSPFNVASAKGPIPVQRMSGAQSQALIESSHETFELLVVRGALIDHYTHFFDSITDGPWTLVATLPPPSHDKRAQVTAVSLREDAPGNLQAIVRVTPPPGGGPDFLVAYEFNSQSGWKGPVNLVADNGPIDKVTGSQAFIRIFIRDKAGSLELLVPRGGLIDHYTNEKGSILAGPWKFVATLKPPKGDAKIQASDVTLTRNTLGELDLIAREKPLAGDDFLVAYEFDPVSGWQGPVDLIADGKPILAGPKRDDGDDSDSDDNDKSDDQKASHGS